MVELNATFQTSVIEFTDVANWISSRISSTKNLGLEDVETIRSKIGSVVPLVEKYDKSFRISKVSIGEDVTLALENAASNLWNSISILLRTEPEVEYRRTFCLGLLFAVLLMSVHEAVTLSVECKLRIFKCSQRLVKFCLEDDFEELLRQGLESADKYLRVLEEVAGGLDARHEAEFRQLKVELFIVNFQLALGAKDMKMARFYEDKIDLESNLSVVTPEQVLEFCRIIYNGMLLLRNSAEGDNPAEVVHFLKCALEYLELPADGLKQHVEYNKTRYTLLLFLTDCVVEAEDVDENMCREYLDNIQNEFPNKIEPFKLAIKFHDKQKGSDVNCREEILMRMLISVNIGANFDSILACINEQAQFDTLSAIRCLDYLFINKLDPAKDGELLEKLANTRLFIISQSISMSNSEKIDSLNQFFSQYERIMIQEPSKTALSSIITLLFNTGKKLQKSGSPDNSIGWFQLALRDCISSQYEDRAKIQRAIQYAYLEVSNYTEVKRIYGEMTKVDQAHPLTQLIMLKVFIAENRQEEAFTCLKGLRESRNNKALDSLILGIVECGDHTELAVKALLLLFDKIEEEGGNSKAVPVTCSIRYTIQIILRLCDKDVETFEKYLPTFSQLLEKGLEYFNRMKTLKAVANVKDLDEKEILSVDDFEWFGSVSYNIGVRCLKHGRIPEATSYAMLAKHFISLIPANDLIQRKQIYYEYWSHRSMTLYLVGISRQLKDHNAPDFIKQCQSLINELKEKISNPDFINLADEELKEDYHQGLLDVMILAFEVAVQSKHEASIRHLVQESAKYNSIPLDTAYFNLVATIDDIPAALLSHITLALVDRNVTALRLDDATLLSWARFTLQNALTIDEKACLKLINELYSRLRSSVTCNQLASSHELEHITTSLWNQGITDIAEENNVLGETWCHRAIQYAGLFNKRLEDQLTQFWQTISSDLHS